MLTKLSVPVSRFDTSEDVSTCAGSPVKVEYAAEVSGTGIIMLHAIGETDLDAYIQSFEESTNINTILERYAAGDESVLNRRQMLFFDSSEMPSTYPEMFERLQKAEMFFDNQSAAFRERFNNDWKQFLSAMDDPQSLAAVAQEFRDAELRRANPAGDSLDRVAHTEQFDKVLDKVVTDPNVSHAPVDHKLDSSVVKEVASNA